MPQKFWNDEVIFYGKFLVSTVCIRSAHDSRSQVAAETHPFDGSAGYICGSASRGSCGAGATRHGMHDALYVAIAKAGDEVPAVVARQGLAQRGLWR